MPQYQVEIPGQGKFLVESPTELTDKQAYMAALRELEPAAPSTPEKQPESGFFPSLKASTAEALGSAALTAGKLGLLNPEEAQKKYEAAQKYSHETFAPTTEGWSQAPWTKFKETLGSSLPYMAAPIVGAAAAPEALGIASLGLGAADVGAGLAGYGQFVGTNLARQVDEGKSLQNASLGSAAAAAVPQAALDVFSLHMIPGIRGIFGKAGIDLTDQAAQQIAKQSLSKTVGSYALATGKAMGAEGLNEAAQQVFERMQAGLNINDPEAREEYFQNFMGGAVLGGALAPFGHMHERAQALAQARAAQAAETPTPVPTTNAAAQPPQEQEVPEPTLRQPTPEEVAEAPTAPAKLTKQQKAEAARQKKDQEDYLRKYAQQAEDRQAAIAEYQRVKAMSPEEYAAEQMQGAGTVPKKRGAAEQPQGDETGYYTQYPPEPAPHEAYAAQQMALAKDREPAPDWNTYTQYLLQDPEKAQTLVEKQTPIPGVPASVSDRILRNIDKELTARKEAAAKAETERVQNAQERARGLFEQQQNPQDLIGATKETPAYETAQKVKAEREALTRIGNKPAPYLTAARDIEQQRKEEGMVNDLVDTLPKAAQILPGQVYKGLGVDDKNVRDLQAQLAVARMTGNREEMGRIKELLDEQRLLGTPQGAGSQTASSQELLGRSQFPQAHAPALTAQADNSHAEQRSTMLQLAKVLTSNTITLPEKRANTISALKEKFVEHHLNEIETRRKAFGLPPMADWERAEARARVMDALNTLSDNSNNSTLVKNVEGLQTAARTSLYDNLQKAAQRNATNEIEKIGEFKPTGPRLATPDELTLKGTPRIPQEEKQAALQTIERVLATLHTRTRAVPQETTKAPEKVKSLDELAKLFAEPKGNVNSAKLEDASVELLEQLRDALPTSNDQDFIQLAREQAQQIAEGNLPNPNAVRELNEMMKAQEVAGRSETRPGATPEELQRTSAQPQLELFPEAAVQTQRATPANFQKMLDSKNIQGMRDALAQAKADNQTALEQIKKRAPSVQKELRAANEALAKAKEKAATLTASAAENRKEPAWYAPAVRQVVELESVLQGVPKRLEALRDIQRSLRGLNAEARASVVQLAEEAKKTAGAKDILESFNDIINAAKDPASLDAEITRLENLVKHAASMIDSARAKLDDLMTSYQKDVVLRNSLERQANKATADVEKAIARLREAQIAYRKERESQIKGEAEPAATPEDRFNEVAQAAREGLGLTGERIQRDTVAIEERAAELRSALGSLDAQIQNAKSEEQRAALQKRYDEKEEELNALPQTAPIVRTALQDRTDIDEAFEREQLKQARAKNLKEGLPSELPSVRRGPIVKDVRTGRTSQTGQRRDIVGRADAVTNALIARRAEMAEVKRRIDFLQEKGKPIPEALTKSFNRIQKRLDAATALQKTVAAQEAQAGKELAKAKKAYGKNEAAREAGGEYANAPVTYLRKTTTEAVRDGRILDAIDDLAANGSTDFVKDLAKHLRPLLMRTKIGTVDNLMLDGKRVGGVYYPAENRIALDDKNMTEEDLVHELVHAATMRVLRAEDDALTPEQLKARNDLKKLYEQIKNDPAFAKEYATKDLEEFVSEVMSNSSLQQKMAQTEVEQTSLLDKFKQFVMRMLGFDTSTFKASKDAIEKIFMPSAKVQEAARASLLRREPQAPGFENALSTANDLIASKPTIKKQIEANLGLAFRTQLLDRLAPLEKVAHEMLDHVRGMQMMYYLRMADQKMSFVQQAVGRGVPERVAYKRPDGKTEYLIESKNGPSLAKVVSKLKNAPNMNAEAANKLFTLYLAGVRGERVGFDTLNFKTDSSKIKEALAQIRGNKALHDVFEDARTEYNAYNKNLVKFLEDSGAISHELAQELSRHNDYIPYYRERNGNAELVIGNEGAYKIGSIADQPQLRQLIGGSEKISDFLTSSVQNTSMIMDMGLRNLATKNAMYELKSLGLADMVGAKHLGPDVIHFKDKGEDRYVKVKTEGVGIPSQLLVKGMEGIPVNNSALVKAMAMPATLLRRAVTLSPAYSARQIFRDSVAAPLLSGANFTPVLAAIKQVGKSTTREKLESRGIVGGQVFTGTNEDLSRILGEFQTGKIGLSQLIARAEGMAMEADALTRRAQYDSYIEQGLSDMEATLMSLESMNFNRKGLSPSVRLATSIIPFFNAQLQSLDVLYRALRGKMPMNERLDIQGKLYRRGAMLAGMSIAYAMLMQDDDLYKNAQPDEKYGNWFVHLPGMKEALRVPVPFEVGYIFKGIPEALVNSMSSDTGAEEAYKAFKNIAIQTVPGASSGFMPAAAKPFVENLTNYSFFTGQQLETKAEQEREAAFRYRDNTSELAKAVGAATGTSPLKIENLIRGYTGTLGATMTQALSMAVPTSGTPDEATKRLTDRPVIGQMFQPADAGGALSDMYDHLSHIKQVGSTYNKLLEEGKQAEAREYIQQNINAITAKTFAGTLQEHMSKIKAAEAAVQASSMSPDEKRARLDELRALKIKIAQNVRGVLEKTKPQ